MRRSLISTIIAFSVSACQSTSGGGCPPLINYSAAQQKQAANELRKMHSEAQVAKMITDYGKLRAACRVGR
jgi:hypothetical protein